MDRIRKINKRSIYLVALLLTVVLYMVYEPFKILSSEIIMLFTSKSSESIIGYLNSYNNISPAVSIALMIFQALIFPFKYEIMIFANMKVFGELMGLVLSLVGRIIGAYICFDIGKTLLSKKVELFTKKFNVNDTTISYIKNSDLANIVIRMIPLNFDLISYFAGIIQLNFKKYMYNSTVWIILTTLSYSIKKGYYSYSYEIRTIFTRLILSILVFIITGKKYKKDIRRM